MEPSSTPTETRWSLTRVLLVGAIGGVIGGVLMALATMLYGAFSDTRSFWDTPTAVWSWVFGAEHFTQNDPGAHVWPVILGIGALLASSIIVGLVFAALMALVPRREDIVPLASGAALGVGLWALFRYAILPINDEGTLFSTDTISPQWVWWIGGAAFGVALGAAYDLARRFAPGRLAPPVPIPRPHLRRPHLRRAA